MLPIALMKGKVDAGFFQPTIRGDSPQQPVTLTISPRLINCRLKKASTLYRWLSRFGCSLLPGEP